jgi:hypothetical protein
VRRLTAIIIILAVSLTACGGGSTGLHDPAKLEQALNGTTVTAVFTEQSVQLKDATCSAMDDGTFDCRVTVPATTSSFGSGNMTATKPETTYTVHVKVATDGQTATATSEANGSAFGDTLGTFEVSLPQEAR